MSMFHFNKIALYPSKLCSCQNLPKCPMWSKSLVLTPNSSCGIWGWGDKQPSFLKISETVVLSHPAIYFNRHQITECCYIALHRIPEGTLNLVLQGWDSLWMVLAAPASLQQCFHTLNTHEWPLQMQLPDSHFFNKSDAWKLGFSMR